MIQSIATTRTTNPHQTIQEGFIDDALISQQYDTNNNTDSIQTSSINRYLKTGIQPKINQLIELTINTNNTQQTISTTNSTLHSFNNSTTQNTLHMTGKIISISSHNTNNYRPSTSLSDVGPQNGSLVLADAIHYLSKELQPPPATTANNGQRDSANGQQRRGSAHSLDRSAQSLDRSAHSLDDGGILLGNPDSPNNLLLLDTSENYSTNNLLDSSTYSFDSMTLLTSNNGICPNDTLPSKWVQLSEARKEIIINGIIGRMGCLHGQEIICEGKFVRLNNGNNSSNSSMDGMSSNNSMQGIQDLNEEDLYRFILVADDSHSENMWRLDVSRLVNLSTRQVNGDKKKIDAAVAVQQQTTMHNNTEIITLQKIIELGEDNLSDITWKLEDSDTTLGPDVGGLINNNNNGNDDTKLQHLYNGTKFSLLVAKLYTQFCNDIGPTKLTLDNFEVQVLRHNEDKKQMTGSNQITIIGMEIIQPTIREEEEEPPKDMLQNLGQLIHAIFSSGTSSTSTQPNQEVSAIRGVNGEDKEGISTRQKAMRSSSKAFFSFDQLLESNQYPISICRLLSDMIDKSSESCNPIQSFDEVIDELEQMVRHPPTYLYDPESTFHSSKLHFGQGFYGRKAEMERILEIALRGDNTGLEAVLVSGPAGCGKTHLAVSNLGSMLEASGWLGCSTAKFERGEESKAKEIMAAVYEKIIADLVDMRGSTNESDVEYSRRATEAILASFDVESLSYMADIAPSIQRLIPGTGRKIVSGGVQQRLFLISKLVFAILSLDRNVFMILDDLQWADWSVFQAFNALLSGELSTSTGQVQGEMSRLLVIGTYRDTEITSDLSQFIEKHTKKGEDVDDCICTEISIPSLSEEDITEMIMIETRLPRRLVSELAKIVLKKTSGHAIFVSQLLNSFVNDSIIKYSPRKYRYDWDIDVVSFTDTSESVASFIVSNLSSLSNEALLCLRVISCFGIQVQISLLNILDGSNISPAGGFDCHLPDLIERGILERAGPIVIFAHDLIQEAVYEDIELSSRHQMHINIGLFLANTASLQLQNQPIETAMNQLFLIEGQGELRGEGIGSSSSTIEPASLISIAASQINQVGPKFVTSQTQRIQFAKFNSRAGKDALQDKSFRRAIYYTQNGLDFLYDVLWREDVHDLTLQLYQDAARSCSARLVHYTNEILTYTNAIVEHATLEDSLATQDLLIRCYEVSGQYDKAISYGVNAMRQLGFDLPVTPTRSLLAQKVVDTEQLILSHDTDQLMKEFNKVDSKTRNVLRLVDSIIHSAYQVGSPYFLLCGCEGVKWSLNHGFCDTSAPALGAFAYFKLMLQQDFNGVRFYVDMIVEIMVKKSKLSMLSFGYKFYGFLHFWFVPLRDTQTILLNLYKKAIRRGETAVAYSSLTGYYRFSFFCGDKLSILSKGIEQQLKSMASHNGNAVRNAALEKETIDTLTGEGSRSHLLKGLLEEAATRQDAQIKETVHMQKFITSFWMGDYQVAMKYSTLALETRTAQMPKIQLVYHIFYRGLISFHLYQNGHGEEWLNEGRKMLAKIEVWHDHSKSIFENKLMLLRAGLYSARGIVRRANQFYEQSIKAARDNGYIHEAGLACEFYAHYLKSCVDFSAADDQYIQAYECYLQWGANAKAKKLKDEHNLDLSNASRVPSAKHDRGV